MDAYTLIEIVGEGTYGRVWKAIDNRSNDIVAIKQIKKPCSSWEECELECELTEVKALFHLKHEPNIVRLRTLFIEHDMLYFVFNYVESTLLRFMNDKIRGLGRNPELLERLSTDRIGLFSEFEIRGWCRQIFQALALMHRPGGYIHRDLKPDNLLVSEDGNVIKIADFGQAREFDSQLPCTDYVTTRAYRAPEVLLNSESYNSAVDMWAVGAIMAELYSFCILFSGSSWEDQLHQICCVIGSPTHESWTEGIQLANACGYEFPQVPIAYAYGLKTLIPSASCEALDLIKSLLTWDPKKRPTALEALKHPYFSPN
ncbi:hypothetical protein MKW94_010281 [Papaver nudicaule]|uniref:Protein kinase domain-containing protein n=1 Tax=Papaver nudicaule TaxID=74823 RepID=A0AA41S2S2_PAPNU|nr:hypothetical protein [Papaver nudicaule]